MRVGDRNEHMNIKYYQSVLVAIMNGFDYLHDWERNYVKKHMVEDDNYELQVYILLVFCRL